MGGGKKQTIGHNYFLGMHLVLARQIDALLQINMASKEAWRGMLKSGRGSVHRPGLFGGTKREGGFSGSFDLLDGSNTQVANDYLATQFGALTSAFRGVVSLVWRRPNIGANSARLPSMEFKLLNTAGIHRGWKVDKALIGAEVSGGGASIYISMDVSASMTPARLATQYTALAAFVRSMKGSLNSIRVVAFSNTVRGSIERFDCNDDDYEDIATWIEDFDNEGGATDWEPAFASAPAFFINDAAIVRDINTVTASDGLDALNGASFGQVSQETRRKVAIFTTDGGASPAAAVAIINSVPNLEVFAFSIDAAVNANILAVDNTDIDGVPVVSGTDPDALLSAFTSATLSWVDMNPAHIIRCLWTDPMRGGVATEDEIGDSFAEAADQLFDEGFGLSVFFRGADLVESDRLEIERHIDGISYRSRATGKIELKLVRNNYDVGDLPVLDSSIVMDWGGLKRSTKSEAPNQLTVVYTKRTNGEAASVTRTNIAGVRRIGQIKPSEPVQYPFCTRASLATRLCLRDLSVQDRPLWSGDLPLAYLPPDLEIGDPFILNEPILGINSVVARILETREGNGKNNSVLVSISEDNFALPSLAASDPDAEPPAPVTPIAQPSPVRITQEAPYYLMVLDQGQIDVDNSLSANPDIGVLLATGTKPTSSHFNITVAVDAGADYENLGDVEFCKSVVTLSELRAEADHVIVTVPSSPDLLGVSVSSLAYIGDELVRVDSMAESGANVEITIGRGCLDTVPAFHAIGSTIVFLQNADPLDTQYVATDVLDVKLLTNLNEQTLSLYSAPVDNIMFDSRAIRPYPPGQFKINGVYTQNLTPATADFTWVGRDRTLQTTLVPEDHDDGAIGPELGVTYIVRVVCFNTFGTLLGTAVDVNVGAATSYALDYGDLLSGTARAHVSVTSVRDGYESWQSPTIVMLVVTGNETTTDGDPVETTDLDLVQLA